MISVLTKRFVLLSMAVALALEIHLEAPAWPPLARLCVVVFAVVLVGGLIRFRVASWAVLLTSYAIPAIMLVVAGHFEPAFECVWLCGVFGLILPGLLRGGWETPRGWRVPMAAWALVVAGTWPVVVWREIDGTPALLDNRTLWTSKLGGQIPVAVIWILWVATTVGLILLAFDWLLGRYGHDRRKQFERDILWPLAGSWVISGLVSLYQSFRNVAFLNPTIFAYQGRAGGLFLDGNAYGIIAALWGPAWVVLCRSIRSTPWRLSAMAAGLALSWLGVWASGSRTALAAAAVGAVFLLWYGLRQFGGIKTLLGAAALAAALVGLIVLMPVGTRGPIARFHEELVRGKNPRTIAENLWRRNGYGVIATRMIEDHPLVGVGIGSFPILLPDYIVLTHYPAILGPDNTQNWFRQQLAELGILGGLPGIVWVCLLFGFLARTRGDGADRLPGTAIKGALVGLGLVSLVGVPTEVPAVALTFFVLVCWYLMFVPRGAQEKLNGRTAFGSRAAWWVALALVACSIGGTAYVAARVLRPPYRALRANWNYEYGMYAIERPAHDPAFRWTRQHAVAVFPARGRYLRLCFWISNPDAAKHPVEVKIWRKDPGKEQLIIDTRLHDSRPVTAYVRVRGTRPRMMLETWVGRTWKPSDYGQKDTRTLGLAIDNWTFVNTPPPGAAVVP